MVTKEVKGMVRGEYGKLACEVDPAIVKKIIGDEPRITCRPADLIEPEMAKYIAEVKASGYYEQEEDVLSYALFPQVATKFFQYRAANKYNVDSEVGDVVTGIQPV